MTWTFEFDGEASGLNTPTRIVHGVERVTWRAVLDGFAAKGNEARVFLDHLAARETAGFCFETPALRIDELDRPFEFVLMDAPELDRPAPDDRAFAEHFASANGPTVASFMNLGSDAWLIAPTPMGEQRAYGHLAAFVRGAPRAQQEELLCVVAEEMLARLSERPLWLNTAGHGVAWLHVRIDERPKYVSYAPYRRGQ